MVSLQNTFVPFTTAPAPTRLSLIKPFFYAVKVAVGVLRVRLLVLGDYRASPAALY